MPMPTRVIFKLDHDAVPWPVDGAVTVLAPRRLPALADPVAALFQRLAEPDAGPDLAEYLRDKATALVVVSDHTRAVAYPAWLPALLDAINLCGVPDECIELLVAVGLHDPEPEALTRGALGDAVCRRVKIVQHRCQDEAELRAVRLADGSSVRVNRRLVDGVGAGGAGLLLTGGIVFHYHAGFGGGRKAVFPGCGAYDDVLANHKLLLDRDGSRGRNPNCQPGRLDGNPIYEQSVAVLQACAPSFLVNALLGEGGKVARFYCGDPVVAHRLGCDFLRAHGTVDLAAPADLVVADAGGWPKDGTLYQAHKAYDNAARAVRPGGALVLLAGLRNGLGPAAFRAALDFGDIEAHREALFGEQYSISAQTCLACREKAARAKTWIVGASAAFHADLRRIGCETAPSPDVALASAQAHLAQSGCTQPRILLMPDAGSVLPTTAGQPAAL